MKESRVKLLENVPPQTWVALSEDESRIVGVGNSFAEAEQKARDSGEREPLITFVSDNKWLPIIAIS